MNNVFFQLKNEFEPAEEYQGSEVVKTILTVVRVIIIFSWKMKLPTTSVNSILDKYDLTTCMKLYFTQICPHNVYETLFYTNISPQRL